MQTDVLLPLRGVAPEADTFGRTATGRRSQAWPAIALVIGLRAVLTAAVVALAWVAVDAFRGGGSFAIIPSLLGLALLLRVGVMAGRNRPPGLRLMRGEQPRLFSLLDDLADRVGTNPPDEVWLSPEVDAFATARRVVPLLGRRRRVLGLGLGLLAVLTVDQAAAVLAHELAHLHAVRWWPLRWLRGAQSALTVAAGSFGRLGGVPFGRLSRLLHHLAGPIFRGEELHADAVAVAAVGSAPVVGALRRIEAAAQLYERYAAQYVEPLWRRGLAPARLAEGFMALRAAAAGLPLDEEDDLGHCDTHPPVRLRVASAAMLDVPVRRLRGWEDGGDEAAWSLLDDPPGLDLRVSRAYTAMALGRGLEISWDHLSPTWYQEDARAGGQALFAAAASLARGRGGLGPSAQPPAPGEDRGGLALVLSVLESGRCAELVTALAAVPGGDPGLAAEVRSCPSSRLPDLARDVLAAYVGRAASASLVDDGGYTWMSLWTGPSVLRAPTGEVADLSELVSAAIKTPAGVDALRRRLAAAGVDV